MISNPSYRVSGGKFTLAMILAVILGALCPVLIALETALLLPVVQLAGVFMVFLFCFAGRAPAMLFMIINLSFTAYTMGSTFMWMGMLAGIMPGIFIMRMIAARVGFFDQMRRGLAAYAVGMFLAILAAAAVFGSNIIGQVKTLLADQLQRMPDEFYAPFVEIMNQTLSGYTMGIPVFTVASYRPMVLATLEVLAEMFSRELPATLLCGTVVSAILSVLWGNWLLARRGLATNESYISPERWFLPGSVTLGLLLMLAAAGILKAAQYRGADTVLNVVYSLITVAFFVQGLAAINRFFYRRGVPSGRRTLMVVLALVLGVLMQIFNLVLFGVGAGSALMGSHGAIREIRERYSDNHSDHDDSDQ